MSSTPPLVSVVRRDDDVAVLRIENGKVNALSSEVLRQLEGAAQALTDDPPGAVVVTGSDRIFAAGADIDEFAGPDEARTIGAHFVRALGAVADIPRTVIAAINGLALGGGCELALACDLRVAAENSRLGQPELLLGIIPGGGGTQRLSRLVGASRAKDIIFSGRQVAADEAQRIGLVDRTAPPGEVQAVALAWAADFARGATAAQGLAKRAIDRGLDVGLGAGVDLEQELFVQSFASDEARIGIESFRAHGPGHADFTRR